MELTARRTCARLLNRAARWRIVGAESRPSHQNLNVSIARRIEGVRGTLRGGRFEAAKPPNWMAVCGSHSSTARYDSAAKRDIAGPVSR